jgi:hypothetical protein
MNATLRQTASTRFVLLIGDTLALLLFVFIGQRDHDIVDPQPVLRLLVTAGAFVLPWVVAALLLGAYPRSPVTLATLMARSLNAWFVALPLALLLRAILNSSDMILAQFMVVAFVLGGLFLLGWRLAFGLLWREKAAKVTSAS